MPVWVYEQTQAHTLLSLFLEAVVCVPVILLEAHGDSYGVIILMARCHSHLKLRCIPLADFTEVGIMSVEVTFEQIFETARLGSRVLTHLLAAQKNPLEGLWKELAAVY